MIKIATSTFVAAALALAAGGALAQGTPGQGPVARDCVDDIVKFCSDKQHGNREVRTCLEANKDKVSAVCKKALDTTGGGRGQNRKP